MYGALTRLPPQLPVLTHSPKETSEEDAFMVEEETQKGGGGPQQYTRSYGEEDTQMRL